MRLPVVCLLLAMTRISYAHQVSNVFAWRDDRDPTHWVLTIRQHLSPLHATRLSPFRTLSRLAGLSSGSADCYRRSDSISNVYYQAHKRINCDIALIKSYHCSIAQSGLSPDVKIERHTVDQTNQRYVTDVMSHENTAQGDFKHSDTSSLTCEALPHAEAWLKRQIPHWQRQLGSQVGYNATQHFAVCRVTDGFPYTLRHQRRLYIHHFNSIDDQLDLTHEYLHLAFDGHPNSWNETYIEQLARHLLLE